MWWLYAISLLYSVHDYSEIVQKGLFICETFHLIFDIHEALNLMLLNFLLQIFAPQCFVILITKARYFDHRVEHFQIFCIRFLLSKQSLVQMLINFNLFDQWFYNFVL